MPSLHDEPETEFTLRLISVNEHKISVIKALRIIVGIGTAEAKGMVESAPSIVLAGVSKAEAKRGLDLLEQAGAWAVIDSPSV